MGFIKYINTNNLSFSAASFTDWSADLQRRNTAPTRVGWGLSMLKIFLAAFHLTIRSEDSALINRRIHLHERAYKKRDSARIRYGFSRNDIEILVNTTPKSIPFNTWQYFVALGWTFLLRSEEIRRCKPNHISEITGPNGVKGFQLRISNNKNTINKNEQKFVFFPTHDIPDCIIPILRKFTRSKEDWKSLSCNNTIIRFLRKAIPIDSSKYEIVVHSFRHGRPADLVLHYGYSDNKLAKVGRWHSQSSVRVYSHV